ncbi:GAF domain-containing protein [Naasia aerilata]|uniref:GAF domain-containing protein n=1 Tax=Naasia aerilata TaxID=1162966 RepID=A0ABN6XR54_9MICO|nr:GAF domain-containing protein [Naasia aerilata]BDZ47413.1 hypothetical protein GCM10025866_33220 [Naasia aerilata]
MAAVRRYGVLESAPTASFDRLTALAARVLRAPAAVVSIVDHDRIWFASHHGVRLDAMDRNPELSGSAILREDPWIIEDALTDPSAADNPLLAAGLGLRSYVGVPLRTQDGHVIGTLCVLDHEPRVVTADDLQTLQDLGEMATGELDLRTAAAMLTLPLV